jgi:hypothetical protein
MASPVLTCVEFAQDGVTCVTTAWVQPAPTVFPPLSASDGQQIGFAVLVGCALILASKLPRRG